MRDVRQLAVVGSGRPSTASTVNGRSSKPSAPKAKPFAQTALRRRGRLLARLADHDLMAVLPCRTEEYGSFEHGGLPVIPSAFMR